MTFKFSVITITKDNPEEFSYTADSLINQKYKNFEWIVIDKSLKKESFEMLDKYKKYIDILKTGIDNGIANAWNHGIKLSSGDYIFILNSGDIYPQNFLMDYFLNISESKYIYFSTVKIQEKSKDKYFYNRGRPGLLGIGMFVPHMTICLSRFFHEKYGLYPELKFSMDFALFHKIFKEEGPKIFKEIKTREKPIFNLGGLSDVFYKESLKTNMEIIQSNGGSKLKVILLFYYFIFKNFIFNIMRNF